MALQENFRYRERGKQIQFIYNKAVDLLASDIEDGKDHFRVLDLFLSMPPIMLPAVFKDWEEKREDYYSLALFAVKAFSKKVKTLNILADLRNVAGLESTHEVAIDMVDLTTPEALTNVFRDYQVMLEKTIEGGREEGVQMVLNLVEGEIPLLRYRNDIARKKFNLSSTLKGETLGFVPTKMEGIDLKFWYPEKNTLPKLSFVVKSLS